MLFLQDFDIIWGVEQGVNMGPTDALSQKDEVDTSDDNWEIILLKGEAHYHHIWWLDAALATKISSSLTDPIITKALAAMNDKEGEPWIPHTSKNDWEYMDSALYFKHWLYIPKLAYHNPVSSPHQSPPGDMKGSSAHFTTCRRKTGGLECPHSYGNSSQDVPIAKLQR